MAKTSWTSGDGSGSTTLVDSVDTIYVSHINEIRTAVNNIEDLSHYGNSVNVNDYSGASLDLQVAVAMADLPNGGIVYIPPGNYNWNSCVTIPYSNIWVVGSGWGTVINLPSDSSETFDGKYNALYYIDKDNIALINTNWVGNYAGNPSQFITGAIFGGVTTNATDRNDGLIVTGNRFYQTYGSAGAYFTSNFFFINNYHEIGHISFNGFGLQHGVIANNIELKNGDDAFAILTTSATTENMRSKKITVTGNVIDYTDTLGSGIGAGVKIHSDTGGYPIKDIVVSGNTIIGEGHGIYQAPVNCYGYSENILINGNVIESTDAGPGVYLAGYADKVKISNNRIKSVGRHGIYSEAGTDMSYTINDNYIEGPNTTDAYYGIFLSPSGGLPKQVQVTGNTIYNYNHGMRIGGISNGNFSNNNIHTCAEGMLFRTVRYGGFGQNCDYNIVNNNRLVNITNNGIKEDEAAGATCDYNTYIGNKVDTATTPYTLVGQNTIIGNT